MGCGTSMPKEPAVFLAKNQPTPSSYLYDGLQRDECLKMTTWSAQRANIDGKLSTARQTVPQGDIDGIQMPEDAEQSRKGGLQYAHQVEYGGIGQPETLSISDASGTQLGTMTMPPYMAFGFAAVLRDAEEQVIAFVATAQKSRPQQTSVTSINIWGVKPIEGQAPTVVGGIDCYLWARAERQGKRIARAPDDVQAFMLYNARNMVVAKGEVDSWTPYQYKFTTPGGDGLMLATFPSNIPRKQRKTYDIKCAAGVDVTLMICMMVAMQVGSDELYNDWSPSD